MHPESLPVHLEEEIYITHVVVVRVVRLLLELLLGVVRACADVRERLISGHICMFEQCKRQSATANAAQTGSKTGLDACSIVR